jgi:integrase/recombinase XerD
VERRGQAIRVMINKANWQQEEPTGCGGGRQLSMDGTSRVTGGVLRVRRPKTNMPIELPLLPAVSKALTAYLRWERPPARSVHSLFLRKNMPYESITSAAIRYRIRHYARLAGIPARVIGAHAFRHSHASRQIDSGANVKVVSDILGHRSSSSTSVYVRVALTRLRAVALPVPR